jgi:predicted peptidase
MRYAIVTLSIFSLSLITLAALAVEPQIGQHAYEFEYQQGQRTDVMKYLLFLPQDYGVDKQKQWPLIFFLHGAGERGTNIELVKVHGPPMIAEQRDDWSFIVVSPQCPAGTWWSAKFNTLNELLDEIIATYAVDTNRLYLTGLSMGGYGTWDWAILFPERFAALAPICGGSSYSSLVCEIKDIPTWVFHGGKDTVVPIAESETLVQALEECDSNVRFTIYPDAGHNSWTVTYDNPELYDWFLQQSLGGITNVPLDRPLVTTTWGELKY